MADSNLFNGEWSVNRDDRHAFADGLMRPWDPADTRLEDGKSERSECGAEKLLKFLYDTCRARIFHISERIHPLKDPEEKMMQLNRVEVPSVSEKKYEFILGQKVKVFTNLSHLKSLQHDTIGWSSSLERACGQIGVVRSCISPNANAVNVYFPKVHYNCFLYAGVLEKISDSEFERAMVEAKARRRWRIGDHVTLRRELNVVKVLQKGFDFPLPIDIFEKCGKIIALCPKGVLVTFDGNYSWKINSSLLVNSDEDFQSEREKQRQSGGVNEGDEISITSNVKKLIDDQKNFGGWATQISSLLGKQLTVLRVCDDQSLIVQSERGRHWRLNARSVVKKGDVEVTNPDDLPFKTGDIVNIALPTNILELFCKNNIPMVFIEYLRLTGTVGFIDDKYQISIRLGNWRYNQFSENMLRHATKEEKEFFREAQARIKNVKVGDIVHLDVGPPNLVRKVLKDSKLHDESIVKALTMSSKLIGFLDENYAAVAYADGSKYKVKLKHLTVPERFCITKSATESINLTKFQEIHEMLQRCANNLPDVFRVAEVKVTVLSIVDGDPPCINFDFSSTESDIKYAQRKIVEWISQKSGWKIEELCTRMVRLENKFDKIAVTVCLSFNGCGEALDATSKYSYEGSPSKIPKTAFDILESQSRYQQEASNEELRARPMQFYRLSNPDLNQDVYFPYVTCEISNTAASLADANSKGGGLVNFKNCNIGEVTIHADTH